MLSFCKKSKFLTLSVHWAILVDRHHDVEVLYLEEENWNCTETVSTTSKQDSSSYVVSNLSIKFNMFNNYVFKAFLLLCPPVIALI